MKGRRDRALHRARPFQLPAHTVDGRLRLPADALDSARAAAPDDPDRFATQLCRRGIRGPDAHGLAQMCTDVDRRGQFGATARSRDGRIRRATYVVGMHRTRSGHFAQLRRRSPDGRAVVIIEPMSRQTLLRHLADLAAGLTLPPHAITGSRSSDDRS